MPIDQDKLQDFLNEHMGGYKIPDWLRGILFGWPPPPHNPTNFGSYDHPGIRPEGGGRLPGVPWKDARHFPIGGVQAPPPRENPNRVPEWMNSLPPGSDLDMQNRYPHAVEKLPQPPPQNPSEPRPQTVGERTPSPPDTAKILQLIQATLDGQVPQGR